MDEKELELFKERIIDQELLEKNNIDFLIENEKEINEEFKKCCEEINVKEELKILAMKHNFVGFCKNSNVDNTNKKFTKN